MLHELIDPRTTLLIAAVMYLLLALSAWYAMAGQRSAQVAQWCAAGLVAAVGVGLVGARGSVPDVLSFHVGNCLCVMALLIWAQVLRSHLERTYPAAHIAVAVGVFALLYSLIHLWSPVLSALFSRLALGLLSAHVAWLAALTARHLGTPNGWPIAAVYGLLAAAFLVQVGNLLVHPVDALSPFSPTLGSVMIALAALGTAIVGSFSYVGLVLDEAVKENGRRLAEQARLFETIHLAEQIALLDRDMSLQVMSAAISHELAQPLTAALTSVQVAGQGVRTGRIGTAALQGLIDQVDTNMGRTAEILDRLAALRAPTRQAGPCIDLRTLLGARVEALRQTLRSKGIAVDWSLPEVAARVHGDPLELSQVIDNLLRNAIEAMEGAPRRLLTLSLSADAGRLRLTIRDTGKGLDADTTAQAMQPFFTTKADGMGVGLSISRAFIERHGGTLHITGEPGGGACVSIELPVRCGDGAC
jgi:signal transduction histidine kinase